MLEDLTNQLQSLTGAISSLGGDSLPLLNVPISNLFDDGGLVSVISLQEETDIEDAILGVFNPMELLQVMNGNVGLLDTKHSDMRRKYLEYEERVGGKPVVKERYISSLKKLFSDPLIDKPCVFPGFEPS